MAENPFLCRQNEDGWCPDHGWDCDDFRLFLIDEAEAGHTTTTDHEEWAS